jgi:hypothetical protein
MGIIHSRKAAFLLPEPDIGGERITGLDVQHPAERAG